MDVVSFETAKALKAAGFPQPDFATGQIWYNDLGAATCIGRNDRPYFHVHSLESGRSDCYILIQEGAFYAPSATDIHRLLEDTILHYNQSTGEFDLFEFADNGGDPIYFYSDFYPAELLAKRWLELNKKG